MIDKEQILTLTQGGLNIFSHYLGFEIAISILIRKVRLTDSTIMVILAILETASGL